MPVRPDASHRRGPGLLTACAIALAAAPAAHASSYQFTAKLYTEALGRAPDGAGWNNYLAYFQSHGCNQPSLAALANAFYVNGEYTGLGYAHSEQVLTVYRGMLSREPTPAEISSATQALDSGEPLGTLVNTLASGSEFTGGVARICQPGGYGWGSNKAASLPVAGGTPETVAALRSRLTTAGHTATASNRVVVTVQPHTVYALDTPLVVPSYVTLETSGEPSSTRYATMARLVRNSMFNAVPSNLDEGTTALVVLEPGASLRSVWVSGQRAAMPAGQQFFVRSTNILALSGTGTSIAQVRSDSAAGFSSLHTLGSFEAAANAPCTNETISGALITSYSAQHYFVTNGYPSDHTDGITFSCDHAVISGNQIVDATDIGIVAFPAYQAGARVQTSSVHDNTVVSAGLPAFAAYGIDHRATKASASFAGLSFNKNQFFAAPDTHFDIGLAVGAFAWGPLQGQTIAQEFPGDGASMTNNTSAGVSTPMQWGIVVDGMTNATVQGNAILRIPANTSHTYQGEPACPAGGNIFAHETSSPLHAGGNLQQPVINHSMDSCLAP